MVIPAFTECLVPAMLQYDSLTPSWKAFATELNSLREGICIARINPTLWLQRPADACTERDRDGLSSSERPRVDRRGSGRRGGYNSVSQGEEISIQSMVDQVDSSVKEEFKTELKEQLLITFKDVFA